MANLEAARKNLGRIAVLCKERNIPYNYAENVDPYYLVIYPGEENQFVVHPETNINDIPEEVFYEISTFRDAEIVVIEYRVNGDTEFEVFDQEGMAPADDGTMVECLHRKLGHNNFIVKKVWR